MKKNNVKDLAIIVQCRLSSKRLPKKALKLLAGKPLIEWTLDAMKKVEAGYYFVAVDEESYKELKPHTEKCGWNIFAGSLEDVLERYCTLIKKINCKTVIRATADNPFLFYEAAQILSEDFFTRSETENIDYMTFTGLPHGSGVEIFNAESLLKAAESTKDSYDHEHVGPALYNHKEFNCIFLKAPSRFFFPNLRTTVDTQADFCRAFLLAQKLVSEYNPPFTTEQIVRFANSEEILNMILFIPSVKAGLGTGHLRRCLAAAAECNGFIYIPEKAELKETSSIIKEFNSVLKDYQIINTFPNPKEFSLIVTDIFNADKKTSEKNYITAAVAAIDEGSDNTDFCDYILDILPSYNLTRCSNLQETAFIEKPVNKKERNCLNLLNNIKNILVCLGGEDPAQLTIPAAIFFNSLQEKKVSAVIAQNKIEEFSHSYPEIEFIPPVKNLKEILADYDLIVTHYGLTAFEAIFAGCAVILLATTELHKKLADKYGFICLTKKELSPALKKQTVKKIYKKNKLLFPEVIMQKENMSLGKYMRFISSGKRYMCPICTDENFPANPVIARTKYRTYRRCNKCSIIYISWAQDSESIKYEKQYFSLQYKEQYGKTYLEDFGTIKKASVKRILEINKIVKSKKNIKPCILDIGCAYGPFLDAASDNGWNPYGTDIAEDAVNYVKNNLLFPAVQSQFPDFEPSDEFGINKFDAVTMWYVIEHFKDLKSVLNKVSAIVKKGGIFAFSTPSGSGVSAKFNRQEFFQNSPSDHYSIWEPSKTEDILKMFGFEVIKIISTGHHAERFPLVKNMGWTKDNFQFKYFQKMSKVFRLGDTFEVYCRKKI